MEQKRFSAVAHATHQFCNPVSEAQITSLLDRLDLAPDHRVIDIGCGKAEMLVRLVDRFACTGTGIDINEEFLREAAQRVQRSRYPKRIEVHQRTGKEVVEAALQYDLSICMGASHAFGVYRDAVNALATITRPNGLILVGEGYWRRSPDQAYLDFLGTNEEELLTHSGNIEAGCQAGRQCLYSSMSDQDAWDTYEENYRLNVERYIDSHPSDPDKAAMLERISSWNLHYHQYGRDTLGFALYLFQKPNAPSQ
jgi:SAM-dependent methyltransferase